MTEASAKKTVYRLRQDRYLQDHGRSLAAGPELEKWNAWEDQEKDT